MKRKNKDFYWYGLIISLFSFIGFFSENPLCLIITFSIGIGMIVQSYER